MILAEDKTWEDIWLRCELAGNDIDNDTGLNKPTVIGPYGRFPEGDISLIYQTQDDNSLPPRTHLLVQRVFQRFRQSFGVDDIKPPTKREMSGAFQLLATIHQQKGHLLSVLDRARLLGAIGMICRSYGEDASPQMQRFWQAKGREALEEAAGLGDAIPAGLRRHLYWLTAEILIGPVTDSGVIANPRNKEEILTNLIKACKGGLSDASSGLYFSCISRLFALPEHYRIRFCEELVPELRRAWTALRAATLKKEAIDDFRNLPFDKLRSGCADMLEWHAEDRFAVCTILAWYEYQRARNDRSRIPLSKVYAFEAAALRSHLSQHRITRPTEPNVEIHSVRALLRAAEGMSRIAMPELPNASVAQTGGQQAMNLIAKGRVSAAIEALTEESRSTQYSLQRKLCRLKIAELLGDTDNASKERTIIAEEINSCTNEKRYDAIIRAEAFRLWARNAANSDCQDNVSEIIQYAQESAGASASPQILLIVERYRLTHSLESGSPLSERAFMGQLIWLSCLWNEPIWIEGDYAANLQGFSRRTTHANRPDDSGPRAFKRWVHDLGRNPKPHEVLKLTELAFRIRIGELFGPWVGGVVNLYLGWVLSHQFPKDMRSRAFAAMDFTIRKLVNLIVNDLNEGRQEDHRERLAMVLCHWLSYRGNNNDLHLSFRDSQKLIFPTLECAIGLAKARIARAKSESQKNTFRKRLRLIVATASETSMLPLLKGRLIDILDDCKTNDADPWHLDTPTEKLPEDFDDTSAVALTDEEEMAARYWSLDNAALPRSTPCSNRAIVSYFLPGRYNNKNDIGAFAVLRRQLHEPKTRTDPDEEHQTKPNDGDMLLAAEEVIFDLPHAHEAIKHFRKTVKQARDLYLKSLPGAPLSTPDIGDGQEISLPRLISDLKHSLTPVARDMGNVAQLNEKLDVAEKALGVLGSSLLPSDMLQAFDCTNELCIIPDGRLFLLPLHALPTADDGSALMDKGFAISYKPRADYCPSRAIGGAREQDIVCINTEDTHFAFGPKFRSLTQKMSGYNTWLSEEHPNERLRKIGKSRRSVVVAHGHARPGEELLSRIAMKDGQCITALDVKLSKYDYRHSQICLFACHSMPQRASIGRELLGLGGTFLSQGVSSVAASIWECEIDDVAMLADALCTAPTEPEVLPKVWCDALRSISRECSSPLERFARVGCFMLYTGT